MTTERVLDILISLSPTHLDLLGWFAEWTPAVYKTRWQKRRAWLPGFREITDLSATWEGHEKWKLAAETMTVPPASCIKKGPSTTAYLLQYGLVEGTSICARLTPRGRAALKYHGRPCVDSFKSHAPDVFDDVCLLPVFLSGMVSLGDEGRLRPGTPLPDDTETWRSLLVEYHDDDYKGRHTLTKASATLSVCQSTGTSLNGSVREHHRFMRIEVKNNEGNHVCDFSLSPEQLADFLTSNMATPVTLGHYIGKGGMMWAEPSPPPVSAMTRMHARLEKGTNRTADQIREIMTEVEGLNLGVKAKASLLHNLQTALDCGDSGHAFAVAQGVEEMSQAVESLFTVAADRAKLAGAGALSLGTAVVQETKALLGPMDIEVEERDPE